MVKGFRRIVASTVLAASLANADSPPASGCEQARQIAHLEPTAAFENPEALLLLADCLGHPDPAIRDEFAYSTFFTVFRDGGDRAVALRPLMKSLSGNLRRAGADADGFRAPFSVLVLAEIARVDRLSPFMTRPERRALVDLAAEYLKGIDDYRGFHPAQGWRHGVAHAADLMMQLALHPELEEADARKMLAAIAAQVVPGKSHFYIYGESRRLARPVLFLAMTDLVSDDQWADWFQAFEANEENPRWSSPYTSVAGLARIHNTEAFASAIFVRANGESKLTRIAAAARSVLKSIP